MGRHTVRPALLAIGGALALAGCGSNSKSATPPATTNQARAGANGCTSVAAPATDARKATKPTKKLDASKHYTVSLQTNCGTFAIELAVKISPATAASFVGLVRDGYLDHTVFHRIVPGFVIQGGDPTASGLGGPGYKTVDKPPASTRYTLGVVAMAKTQSEPAGTSGSQFFVVTAKDARLPPDYAVLGKVTSGSNVVTRIGKLGDPASEQPTQTVEIEKATVREASA
jgi:peptidyl-prolyl cis-trans isomerase B (cyclophilin B)